MSTQISTAQILGRLVISYGIMATVIFWSAGTLYWHEAWLYLLLQVSFSAAEAAWLKKNNPELLKERMTYLKSSAAGWDKAFMWISTAVFIPYLVLPGLDAVRYQWSEVPMAIEAAGFVGIVFSLLLILWVVQENPFLSRVVEIQTERNHRVVTTGPYRYVRHPMYSGVLVLLFCIPLALGSFWDLVPAVFLAASIVVRTLLEEKTLHRELEGYGAYVARVKYRVFPGIW